METNAIPSLKHVYRATFDWAIKLWVESVSCPNYISPLLSDVSIKQKI